MTDATRTIGMVLIGVGIFSIVVFLLVSNVIGIPGLSLPGQSPTPPKYKIECDVKVVNDIFGKAHIEEFSCTKRGSCWFSFQSIPFGIFGEEGIIRLKTNDANTFTTFKFGILEGWDTTKTLSVCTTENSGEIRVESKDGKTIWDKKPFTV